MILIWIQCGYVIDIMVLLIRIYCGVW